MGGDFRVGSWLVQPGLNTISSNGITVRLEPKVMEVLVCLSNQAGEPIVKEELLRSVWRDTFVSDDVLVRSISELRRVFEDDPRQPQFIQTIPKRGYRLLAPVRPANGLPTAGPLAPQPLAPQDIAVKPKRRRMFLLAAGLAAAAVILLFALDLGGFRGMLRPNPPAIRSLAVLPLQNLSDDPGQDYFADGMTEELITELSRLNAMKVISRTSVMRYRNSSKSLPEIARELNVDAILEGSVLRSGDRVRITAQLIHAHTDANLWAETYDRTLEDTLRVQETVATAIATKIKASLVPIGTTGSKTEHAVNFKAHEAYLRGLQQYGLEGDAGNHLGMEAAQQEHHQRALAYFEDAIREDPEYAPAYVALAGASLDAEKAEAYARKALEADSRSAPAHLILAAIKLQRDRDWQDAEREILQAIELNPSSAAAHQQYAFLLDAAGRLEEGLKEYRRAQELDPAADHLLTALYSRHKFDDVIETAEAALARTPNDLTTPAAIYHKTLMVAYARTGRQKESVEQFRAALTSMGYTGMAEQLRRGFLRGGYEGALRAWLKTDRKDFPFRYVDAYVYTELGDYDHAFALLPKSLVSGPYRIEWDVAYSDANAGNYCDTTSFPTPVTLRIDPMWDPLHRNPKFDELIRSVGFPE